MGCIVEIIKEIFFPALSLIAICWAAVFTYLKCLENGKMQAMEIAKRYIVTLMNYFKQSPNPELKKVPLEREIYLKELKSIYADTKALLGNPLATKIFIKHTNLTMLMYSLGREIVTQEQPNAQYVINGDTLKSFLDFYDAIKLEFKMDFFKNDCLKEIDNFANTLKREIRSQKTEVCDNGAVA